MEKFPELKEDVRQLIADIIGDNEFDKDSPEYANQFRRDQLRYEQRQRAKERGIDLEAGDAS